MVNRKKNLSHFFSEQEKERVVSAIRRVESKTSGEIRVALNEEAWGDGMAYAQKVFKKLGMAKTKHRNGILFFLAVKDRFFAILGDKGIHEKLGNEFWKGAAAGVQPFFVREEFGAGLEWAIQTIGESLARYFPRQKDDTNELTNRVLQSWPGDADK